jgi:TonB family protein
MGRPDGSVTNVSVIQSSGFKGLDKAAIEMMRGARLPPFSPDMTQSRTTVTVPITYDLE